MTQRFSVDRVDRPPGGRVRFPGVVNPETAFETAISLDQGDKHQVGQSVRSGQFDLPVGYCDRDRWRFGNAEPIRPPVLGGVVPKPGLQNRASWLVVSRCGSMRTDSIDACIACSYRPSRYSAVAHVSRKAAR